jgi:hypothetical protein
MPGFGAGPANAAPAHRRAMSTVTVTPLFCMLFMDLSQRTCPRR